MIRIELDEPTLSRTRISTSPLWEAICSLFLVDRHPTAAPWPYTDWAVRARAADGPDALLANLHARVRWERPLLTLVKRPEQAFTAVDQRLVLIPLIFSRGALACSTNHPEVLAVSYQARGAALLADRPTAGTPTVDTDRLAILVGRGRATVLRSLARPATTAGLAAALNLAPSTVSEHLSALVAAGVVNRRRVGRRVLYGLEPAGVALINLLGEESTAA